MPCLWHGDIIIGQPLVSSQLSHFLNWQYPKDPGNSAWGKNKSLMFYLRDENSGQWEWGQGKMRQGMMDETQGDLLPWSLLLHKMWTDTQMCLFASKMSSDKLHLYSTSQKSNRKEKGDRIYLLSSLPSFVLVQRASLGELTPLDFRLRVNLARISHQYGNGMKRPNFLWSTHLPLQETNGQWQMLDSPGAEK